MKARLLMAIAIAMATSGCAAYIAENGIAGPKIDWPEGSARAAVEEELGKPVSSRPVGGGYQQAVYEYWTKPPRYPRGSPMVQMHGLMTALSLGLWELVALPVEGLRGWKRAKAEIVFDANDRVAAKDAVR